MAFVGGWIPTKGGSTVLYMYADDNKGRILIGFHLFFWCCLTLFAQSKQLPVVDIGALVAWWEVPTWEEQFIPSSNCIISTCCWIYCWRPRTVMKDMMPPIGYHCQDGSQKSTSKFTTLFFVLLLSGEQFVAGKSQSDCQVKSALYLQQDNTNKKYGMLVCECLQHQF